MIHAQILRRLSRSFPQQQRLVLVTGDGNSNNDRTSFPEVVDIALQRDWLVEVWAWRGACSARYLQMQDAYASSGKFKLLFLDDVRDNLQYHGWTSVREHTKVAQSYERSQLSPHAASEPASPRAPEPEHLDLDLVAPLLDLDDPPDALCDPITMELMDNPVKTPQGVVYERSVIEAIIAMDGLCPCTRLPLSSGDLVPDQEIQEQISKFRLSATQSTRADGGNLEAARRVPPTVHERESPPDHHGNLVLQMENVPIGCTGFHFLTNEVIGTILQRELQLRDVRAQHVVVDAEQRSASVSVDSSLNDQSSLVRRLQNLDGMLRIRNFKTQQEVPVLIYVST